MWEGAHMMMFRPIMTMDPWSTISFPLVGSQYSRKGNFPRVPQSLYSLTRALRVVASLHLFSHAFLVWLLTLVCESIKKGMSKMRKVSYFEGMWRSTAEYKSGQCLKVVEALRLPSCSPQDSLMVINKTIFFTFLFLS